MGRAGLVIDGPEAFAAAFDVSRETCERLAGYVELLNRWSKVQDLVAPSTLPDVWHRHMADSAQLLHHAPNARVWVDAGTGAGFPGLVLAILSPPDSGRVFHLIESNARKCAFLRDVARRCGAPVDIHCMRIEVAATQITFPTVDVVTARALASLDKLLGLVEPIFAPTTQGLFLKGRGAEAEVAEARRVWHFVADFLPSMTDPDGRIVSIRQLGSLEGAGT